MIAAALSFLAGLLLVQQLSVLPDSLWIMVLIVLAGIMAWQGQRRWLFLLLGIVWATMFAQYRLIDRLPSSLEGKELWVSGYIADLPETDDHKTRFDCVLTPPIPALPKRLRLSWYNTNLALKAGQHWSFMVKLKRPHGSLNLGGFDYERWLFTENIGATGYVRAYPVPVLIKQDSAWLNPAIWRQQIADRLTVLLQNQSQLALIKALTIGDGSTISQAQWAVFRETGTTHLVVISGSHVGLIAGLVYFLVLKLWARTGLLKWSPPRVAAVIALLAGVFYAALAGFSIPTQRALIMLAMVMLAIIWQRHTQPFNTLAVALLAVLIYDPLAVLSAGFWLSYLAVSLIVYALSGRLAKAHYFVEISKMNWATTVGLSPLLLYFFQQVSLISPLANFIAVPVISLLVVPLALLAVLLMWISPVLASKLFWLVDVSLQALWWLLVRLAELPLATFHHPQPPLWTMVFTIPAIVLLLAPRGMPARWLSGILFLPLFFTSTPTPPKGMFKLTLLDVGQGLSVVVQTTTHNLVYDTGAKFSPQSDSGQAVLLPFLQHQGIKKLDKLIISHGDNDHIGGANSLLHGIETLQIISSVQQQLKEFSPIPCQAGMTWGWDGVSFELLSPQQAFASDNDNSCVLKIRSQYGAVLLTGDIEAPAESWLVKTYNQQLQAKLLIAPHHGSKTSSTLAFLNAVQPEWVLIPAGYLNQFGHPHPNVLQRYTQRHVHWLNSANSGAITVNSDKGSWQVRALRNTERRYWQDDK